MVGFFKKYNPFKSINYNSLKAKIIFFLLFFFISIKKTQPHLLYLNHTHNKAVYILAAFAGKQGNFGPIKCPSIFSYAKRQKG
jgi:hypothetical protein